MKWVYVNQPSAYIKKYHLTEGNDTKLVMKYNLEQQSVRISSEENHRLFFINKTGLWHNKTILKNEYGVEIGRLLFDKAHGTGIIEMERKKYYYTFQNNTELVIFEHTVSHPLAVCDLSSAPSFTSVAANKYSSEESACFLLGICWYLFPLTATEQLEYAGATTVA
ncbi:hypothetical protein FAM09_08210 [Niastella caeni]|uniref:Uncharacterized protein n=1 Tax=Niastella caeni TaxID=2569763 RepID=A0A4S8HX68_9BACT|nr:hypothetical protein [Niastella caeni]THU39871.1 hypothetical protein FAM09_08210 [Niastella caeni]